jgi:hypothetical protein
MALVARIPQGAGVIPAQVLGELFNVLVRKPGRSRETAKDVLLSWPMRSPLPRPNRSPCCWPPISPPTISSAFGIR